jgi:hypothetical protein
LADLVAAGDMINHAILLEDEVETALGKLAGAGLVRVFEDWTFEVTDEGAAFWSESRRDLWALIDSVAAELAQVDPGQTKVELPRGSMDDAVKAYLRRAQG